MVQILHFVDIKIGLVVFQPNNSPKFYADFQHKHLCVFKTVTDSIETILCLNLSGFFCILDNVIHLLIQAEYVACIQLMWAWDTTVCALIVVSESFTNLQRMDS